MIWVKVWRRNIFTHFHNEKNIFKPKNNFSQRKQHFHIQRRPKCYSDILRTPSPMLSHQLHCHDYRDNVYIFMYTFYLYVLCTIKHPKHPKRIRFTYTFCAQLDVLNVLRIGQPDTPNAVPLTPLIIRLVSLIRIRITYTFNVVAPLAYSFNPLYLYV